MLGGMPVGVAQRKDTTVWREGISSQDGESGGSGKSALRRPILMKALEEQRGMVCSKSLSA